MPTKVPTAAEIAAKWAEMTPGRQKFYAANTAAAAGDWERETKAATATFVAALQTGDIGKKFSGGVTRAGAAKFARKVTDVGVDRFSPGVRAATQDMAAGVDPYVQAIASVTPPPRGPRGDPSNLERVRAYSEVLAKKRLALLGAG